MLRYYISVLCLFLMFMVTAQSKPIDTTPKDTVIYKQLYGIRVGIDLSRPIIGVLDENYSGWEVVADYRLTQKLYVATEFGNENKTQQEDTYNFTTAGSYIKVGVDNNTYANWYGEQNAIYFGGRLAFSTLNQTLNNYQIFNNNRYWNPDGFANVSNTSEEFNGRTATWLEGVLGTKVELFSNLFMGASVRIGFLISDSANGRFPNLFIPGFNKVTWGSKFGVGYNYTLSYLIPFSKKKNKTPETPAIKAQEP